MSQFDEWNCLTEEFAVMADNGGGAIVTTSSIAGLSAARGARTSRASTVSSASRGSPSGSMGPPAFG